MVQRLLFLRFLGLIACAALSAAAETKVKTPGAKINIRTRMITEIIMMLSGFESSS